MKKLFATALTAVLALSLFIPSIHQLKATAIKLDDILESIRESLITDEQTELVTPSEEGMKLLPLEIYGTIIAESDTSITIKDDLSDNTVILHISQDTYIVDATTGIAAMLKDRSSDRIAAFYGPAATMSIPAQSNAVAIALNLPENNRSPKFVIVEALEKLEGAVKITTNNGGLIITINSENPIIPYRTRNIVTLDHIQVGAELMVWYDMVAMSYPGQTTSNRTVFFGIKAADDIIGNSTELADSNIIGSALPEGAAARLNDLTSHMPIDNGSMTVFTKAGVAVVNGTEVNLDPAPYVTKTVFSNMDVHMLPLRPICESLGFEVNWLAGTNQIELVKENISVTFEIGRSAYTIKDTDSDASVVINSDSDPAYTSVIDSKTNRSYIHSDFFSSILNVDVTIDDSEV